MAQGKAGAATRETAAYGLLRLTGAPHPRRDGASVVDSRSSGRHTHPSFVMGFAAEAVRRLEARGAGCSEAQRAVRAELQQLECGEQEWMDGWALFEEGSSRAALQD